VALAAAVAVDNNRGKLAEWMESKGLGSKDNTKGNFDAVLGSRTERAVVADDDTTEASMDWPLVGGSDDAVATIRQSSSSSK
jgi:hypothetical protein